MNSGRHETTEKRAIAPQPSDADLVASTLAGDRESFGTIVHRYQGPLLRLAHSRLGQIELAEEVVQEAFASAYRSLRSYRSEFSFRTWLWTILLNGCKRKYKQIMSKPTTTELGLLDSKSIDVSEDVKFGPLQLAISNERTEHLNSLLSQLPDAQNNALRLRFFGGLRYQEIADTMDCSLSTAKMRVRVGLEKLATMLLPSESTDSPGGDSKQ